MPRGSGPLLPLQWQPVPGCTGAEIYPLTRKVDTSSSNSYLLRTPDAVMVIDPGGLPEQAERIASLVLETRAVSPRPLVVVLTHAHVDHYAGMLSVPLLVEAETAVIAAQESGARALETANPQLTLAEILGCEIAPLRVDLPLLAGGDGPIRHTYANGAAVTVVRQPPKSGLRCERLVVGAGSPLELYHTPGHSPDSCCLQIGRILFTGDLLFGASPGMAGIHGWDQDELIRSLTQVRALVSRGGIEAVCPGHGAVLSTGEAVNMLDAVEREARLLTGIAEWDLDRAGQTAAFAEECMEQVSELFTVMTGRLYYVSHVMDELGEDGTAAALQALISGDAVDDLLDGFDAFNREYHAGGYIPVNLALKGGQVIGKLQRSFDQEALAQIIPPSLVRRAERLLGDYTTVLRGFEPARELAVHDLRDVLETVVADQTRQSCSDDDLLTSADDDAAFERLLLARIGMPPLLADVAVELDLGAEPLPVLVDRDRAFDLVTYLLEELVGTEARAVAVRAWRDGDGALAAVSGAGWAASPTGAEPRKFLYGLCERAGGVLEVDDTAGSRGFRIGFASVI